MTTVPRWGSTGAVLALLGAAGGAVYAVLTLIVGVGAIVWLILLIVVSRRLSSRALPLPAVGFVVGFVIAFWGLLIPASLSCQPPGCFATPWYADLTWVVVDLAVAAAVFGIARLGMFLATLARRT
jgi:Ni/Fe-hydrogenase subunit HybB-like protein